MRLHDTDEFRQWPGLASRLYDFSIHKNYPPGAVIVADKAHIRSIPIVVNGAVRVMRTGDDGRELLLYYIRSGESCVMSFLGGMHNETSKVRAEVEEESEILFLPVEKVPVLIQEYPQWLDYIFRLYHKRFSDLLIMVDAIAFQKVDDRLLALLRKKADLAASRVVMTTHEQLANELGTARVVVSRLLKKLEENKVVKLGRNKILLK